MKEFLFATKEFILDILFPKFCLNCGKEGDYLCNDCFSLADILNRQYCPFCWPPKAVIDGKTCKSCRRTKKLNGLYYASPYENFLIKKLINQFKYQPYIKELSKPLASLILAHFANLDTDNKTLIARVVARDPDSGNFRDSDNLRENDDVILIPVPLYKKKLKERGFNQAEEIAKELSKSLKIPVFSDILIKIKSTPAQVDLTKKQRKKNIIGVFSVQKPEIIMGKRILLIDDIFTTGSTMEECAKTLKQAKAKQVWGVAVARG